MSFANLIQKVQAPFLPQQQPVNVTLVHPEDDLGHDFEGDIEPDAQEINLHNDEASSNSAANTSSHVDAAPLLSDSSKSKKPLFDKSDVIQLPEYLSEALLPSSPFAKLASPIVLRRICEVLLVANRIILRLVFPITCLLPGTAGFVMGLVLAIASFCVIMPVLLYLLVLGWRKRKNLLWNACQSSALADSEAAFQFNNEPVVVKHDNDEEEAGGEHDAENATSSKTASQILDESNEEEKEDLNPHVIPVTVYGLKSILFTTEIWALYIPILFEICSWIIFFVAVMVRIAHEVVYPFSFWNGQVLTWLMYSILPLATGLAYNLCAFFIPIYDLEQALDANDRIVVYNDRGMVANNFCLDQLQRSHTIYNYIDSWECSNIRNPVILFEQIKEVALAISLETVDHKAINMPWLYISTLQPNTDIEHRFVLPIRLPEHNEGTWNIFRHIFSNALNDGLSVDETVELLMRCVVYKRKDLSDNVSRVVRIIKSVKAWGFSNF